MEDAGLPFGSSRAGSRFAKCSSICTSHAATPMPSTCQAKAPGSSRLMGKAGFWIGQSTRQPQDPPASSCSCGEGHHATQLTGSSSCHTRMQRPVRTSHSRTVPSSAIVCGEREAGSARQTKRRSAPLPCLSAQDECRACQVQAAAGLGTVINEGSPRSTHLSPTAATGRLGLGTRCARAWCARCSAPTAGRGRAAGPEAWAAWAPEPRGLWRAGGAVRARGEWVRVRKAVGGERASQRMQVGSGRVAKQAREDSRWAKRAVLARHTYTQRQPRARLPPSPSMMSRLRRVRGHR